MHLTRNLLAILLLLSSPVMAAEKPVIQSQLLDFERAMVVGGARATFECRGRIEKPMTEIETRSVLKGIGISMTEFNDPVTKLISKKLSNHISKDCRSMDKVEAGRALTQVAIEYDLRFNKNANKLKVLSLKEFTLASIVASKFQCFENRGLLKGKEKTDKMGAAILELGLPLYSLTNINVISASSSVQPFIGEDCEDFKDEDKFYETIERYHQKQ